MRAFKLSWILALAVLALAPAAEATPVCTAPARLMQWPATSPVWEFCFLTPGQSSGPNGSGIELRDVYYKGHLVLKRAHEPILNVLYQSGCGCFRDWSYSEVRFEAIGASGPISAGPGAFADVVVPPRTVCDVGGSGGDLGSFRGVAAEKLSDQLILTSQFSAGWYRYMMKWRFFLDGRIEPEFGFGAIQASCIAYNHTHHVYWRLDFDIDGAANDHVGFDASPGPNGSLTPSNTLDTEKMAKLTDTHPLNGVPLVVQDAVTGRGYRILAEKAAREQPADTFAVGDVWVLKYSATEISDTGGACATSLNNYVSPAASVYNQDLVVWVRGGAFHAASDLDDCHRTSIVLEPVGDWSP
jgi:hypothetical protein